MYVRSAGPFAKVVMRNSRMSDPRLIWTAMRGLPCLCLAVTATLLGAASCGPASPTSPAVSPRSTVPTPPTASLSPPSGTYNKLSALSGQGGGPDYSNLPNLPVEFSGQGILLSTQFLVNTGTVTVDYTYDCSAAGSVKFVADIISDYHGPGLFPVPHEDAYQQITNRIANASGAAGWRSTTVYLHQVSDEYFLMVVAGHPLGPGCKWDIVVKNG